MLNNSKRICRGNLKHSPDISVHILYIYNLVLKIFNYFNPLNDPFAPFYDASVLP